MSKKKEKIVSYTAEEILQGKAGKSQTDWKKVESITDEELEEIVKNDPDDVYLSDEELTKAKWVSLYDEPTGKERITINVDKDVLKFFKKGGRGYQTRMNRALRAFMKAKKSEVDNHPS